MARLLLCYSVKLLCYSSAYMRCMLRNLEQNYLKMRFEAVVLCVVEVPNCFVALTNTQAIHLGSAYVGLVVKPLYEEVVSSQLQFPAPRSFIFFCCFFYSDCGTVNIVTL